MTLNCDTADGIELQAENRIPTKEASILGKAIQVAAEDA